MTETPLRVLMIDDEQATYVLTRESLREAGYVVDLDWVESFDEGLTKIRQGQYDAYLLDYRLGNRDGLELLHAAGAAGCTAPIIMLTGFGKSDIDVQSLKAGAADYLKKEALTPEMLWRSVRYSIERAKVQLALARQSVELLASQTRVLKIIESTADVILIVSSAGQVRFHNPAAFDVFGDRDLIAEELPFPIHDRGLTEVTITRPDGRVVLGEIRSADIDWEDEPCRMVMLRDITERRRTESELEAAHTKMRVAGEMQQRMFPKNPPVIPGWDIAGRCEPADSTGGDYFDFIPLADGKLAIVLADVSGHGLASALVMIETRAVLRTLVNLHADPGTIVTRLNSRLASDVGERGFVAMMLLVLDPATGEICYCGAGHHAYVFGRDGALQQTLMPSGPPLNVAEDFQFPSAQLSLNSGELLFIYTDGISDNLSVDGDAFSTERVMQHVADNRHRSAELLIESLFEASHNFAHFPTIQVDDMTAVVVKA